jgi:glycosyltransferase involved in cell wall biosynthesis
VQRLLSALAAQTIAPDIEVVVVDCRTGLAGIEPPDGLRVRILSGDSLSFGEARAKAAREARAEIVAFIEDHCYPEPAWAEALVAAYSGPWASVGYAIGSANPRNLFSRINHLAAYGQWISPRRGPTVALPGNNVSYRRERLLELNSDLAAMLNADFNIHAVLRGRGLALASEPDARVRHENEESLLDAYRGTFAYSRLLATERARLAGWRRTRRFVRAVVVLVGAPLVRLAGLVRASSRHPRRLARIALYLPAILSTYLASALGESAGYLLGPGTAQERMMHWEVDAPRADARRRG